MLCSEFPDILPDSDDEVKLVESLDIPVLYKIELMLEYFRMQN